MSDGDVLHAAVRAALSLAAERDWETLSLSEIAEAAGVPLTDFYGLGGIAAIAAGIEPFFDQCMSSEAAEPEDTARDRLFDVIMRRYEAMEPHRDGLISIQLWRERSPMRIAALLRARQASAKWALVCAGLDGEPGPPLALKSANVAWAIAMADRAWRKDVNGDFARTMSTLDRELRDAEGRAKRYAAFAGRRSHRASEASEGAPEAPPTETSQG
ncbi:MAG: hypothetical protein AAFQ67_07000 [Pseudomonadota bacterium]